MGHSVSGSLLCFLPLGGGVRSPDGRGETLFCSDNMAFLACALSCRQEQSVTTGASVSGCQRLCAVSCGGE